jgi:hypothetical protein
MMRRGILTLARVSPPSRRSEFVITFLELRLAASLPPDVLALAAPTAACRRHVENKPAHAQPEESL